MSTELMLYPGHHECTGECCQSFALPYSPNELAAKGHEDPFGEAAKISGMVDYLGYFPVAPRGCGCEVPDGVPRETAGHWYTCRHFDAKRRRCRDYENRPLMCRLYPNYRKCVKMGCTLVETDKTRIERLRAAFTHS